MKNQIFGNGGLGFEVGCFWGSWAGKSWPHIFVVFDSIPKAHFCVARRSPLFSGRIIDRIHETRKDTDRTSQLRGLREMLRYNRRWCWSGVVAKLQEISWGKASVREQTGVNNNINRAHDDRAAGTTNRRNCALAELKRITLILRSAYCSVRCALCRRALRYTDEIFGQGHVYFVRITERQKRVASYTCDGIYQGVITANDYDYTWRGFTGIYRGLPLLESKFRLRPHNTTWWTLNLQKQKTALST